MFTHAGPFQFHVPVQQWDIASISHSLTVTGLMCMSTWGIQWWACPGGMRLIPPNGKAPAGLCGFKCRVRDVWFLSCCESEPEFVSSHCVCLLPCWDGKNKHTVSFYVHTHRVVRQQPLWTRLNDAYTALRNLKGWASLSHLHCVRLPCWEEPWPWRLFGKVLWNGEVVALQWTLCKLAILRIIELNFSVAPLDHFFEWHADMPQEICLPTAGLHPFRRDLRCSLISHFGVATSDELLQLGSLLFNRKGRKADSCR